MGIIREQVLGLLTTPPKFGRGISAVGNVPKIQRYDATSGTYEPDYTVTPLTLQIDVAAIDGDTAFSSTNARTLLSNIHWYELAANGTRTEITIAGGVSSPAGYTVLINTEGDADAGRLQVAKNAAPDTPIMLQFEADLYTGNDTFHICENINVQCRDVTPSVRCKFDTPDIVPYNPIHDASTLPIALSVWENGGVADSSHYIPVWEVRRDDGSWSEYGQELTDYWLTIAADKHSAVLNFELMGDGVSIRVRLRYDRNGNPSTVTLPTGDSSVPMCRLECNRSLGKYDYRTLNLPNPIPEWCKVIHPTVVFEDGQGEIDNPDKYFIVTMYACPATRAITASDVVGTGRSMDISVNGKSTRFALSVNEIGPLKAWVDSDGAIITDADGSILLIR